MRLLIAASLIFMAGMAGAPAVAQSVPPSPAADVVDASTLDRKLLFGYQGWFACPHDESPANRWWHWFHHGSAVATNANVDFWPDVSELGPDERFATEMTMLDGTPACVYSAFNQKTVVRHLKWMRDYDLDGVFLQRFVCELPDKRFREIRDKVTESVRLGAEQYGRVFAIMYDISGANPATLVKTLTNDWRHLTTLGVPNSPRYVHHHGKPVVAIWGFGFGSRPGSPEDALAVIGFFKSAGLTVIGGVPPYWRTQKEESKAGAGWAKVYRSFDIIQPWMVGRFENWQGADDFKRRVIVPDLAEARSLGVGYMPVVFPGFSWHNQKHGRLNQIPRHGGAFYWRQMQDVVSAGCTMAFGAMFDELDEGTAIFKVAATRAELPAQGVFIPLDIEGQRLPSDWYLRVAGQAARMLRREISPQSPLPIRP